MVFKIPLVSEEKTDLLLQWLLYKPEEDTGFSNTVQYEK